MVLVIICTTEYAQSRVTYMVYGKKCIAVCGISACKTEFLVQNQQLMIAEFPKVCEPIVYYCAHAHCSR